MLLFVTHVRESKPSINDLLGCCNPRKYPSRIGMDFVMGLPRIQSRYDSLCVIMDGLTKLAHFIPIKMTYIGPQLAELYMSNIVYLHRGLCPIEEPHLFCSSGKGFMKPWIPI
jgi:hypothetical protein